jgi:hypothetical protein
LKGAKGFRRFGAGLLVAVCLSVGVALLAASTASASSVTGVSFVSTSYLEGDTAATWTVGFTPSGAGALTTGNTVVATFPAGFVVSAAVGSLGTGFTGCGAATTVITGQNVFVRLVGAGCALGAGVAATVTITGINPLATQYSRFGFSVSTYTDASFTTPIDGSGANPPAFIEIFNSTVYSTTTSGGHPTASGAAPPDPSSPYSSGATVTVLGNTGSLTLAGHAFAGWCTVSTATDTTCAGGTHYNAADTFLIAGNVTLYSQWTVADGSGTNAVSPTSVTASSTANTLTFTYTAAAGGTSAGELDIVVPAFWTTPTAANAAGCTTTSTGTLSFSANTIKVSALTLAGAGTVTVTYGATSGGACTASGGATAQSGAGTATFSTTEKSTAGGTLTALSASPAVTVTAASCSAGSYLSGGSCQACPTGSWSAGGAAVSCSTWTQCLSPQVETRTGSASQDRGCGPPPPRVTGLTPSSGPGTAETLITITGSGFPTDTNGLYVSYGLGVAMHQCGVIVATTVAITCKLGANVGATNDFLSFTVNFLVTGSVQHVPGSYTVAKVCSAGQFHSAGGACAVAGNGGATYQCSPGSYKSGTAATGNSNFDTQTCTLAGNGGANYQCLADFYRTGTAADGTGFSDTQTCAAVSNCSAGQYQAEAPGQDSDSVCAPCRPVAHAKASTCTSASNFIASACDDGYTLVNGNCTDDLKPRLDTLSPQPQVYANGRQTVTLTGSNLDSHSRGLVVVVGTAQPVECASFSWISSQAVTCMLPTRLPSGKPLNFIIWVSREVQSEPGGTVDVVEDPLLRSAKIVGLSVTLTGAGFNVSGSVGVAFARPGSIDSTPEWCGNASVVSPTSITCTLSAELPPGSQVTFNVGLEGIPVALTTTVVVPKTLYITPPREAQLAQGAVTSTFLLEGYFGETAPRTLTAALDKAGTRACSPAEWKSSTSLVVTCPVSEPRYTSSGLFVTVDGVVLKTTVDVSWTCNQNWFGPTCETQTLTFSSLETSTLYSVTALQGKVTVSINAVYLSSLSEDARAAFLAEIAKALGLSKASITFQSSSASSSIRITSARHAAVTTGVRIVGLRTIRVPAALGRAVSVTLQSPLVRRGDVAFAYTPAGLTPLAVATEAGRVSVQVTGTTTVLLLRLPAAGSGYRTVTAAGTGNRYGAGAIPNVGRSAGTVAAAATTDGRGGAVVDGGGRVRTYGTLLASGSLEAGSLATAIAVLPSGGGYLVADARGRVHPFGSAHWYGDVSNEPGSARIVAILPAVDGRGYVLVTQSGLVRSYGTAATLPALVRHGASWPLAAATLTGAGTGLLLADTRGHVFALGSARAHGDLSRRLPAGPVVGIVASPSGGGYTLVTSTGAAYRFGDASTARARAAVDQGLIVAVTA